MSHCPLALTAYGPPSVAALAAVRTARNGVIPAGAVRSVTLRELIARGWAYPLKMRVDRLWSYRLTGREPQV